MKTANVILSKSELKGMVSVVKDIITAQVGSRLTTLKAGTTEATRKTWRPGQAVMP